MSIECPGVVTTGSDGSALCTDGGGNVVAWVAVPPFSVANLDYGQAGDAFAAGFVIVAMCWALGKVIGAIFDVIRRS